MSLRRLHALGKSAGLDHEALRAFAGVKSLTDLDAAGIDRVCRDLHRRMQPRRVAPRGKVRPEGVTALATRKQKWTIRNWLDRLLAQQGMTLPMVHAIARQALGDSLALTGEPLSTRQIADAVLTDADARTMIKTLFGELKRRGLWR